MIIRTTEDYSNSYGRLHLLHDVVSYWAAAIPEETAIWSWDRKRRVSWAELAGSMDRLALQLLRLGLRRGDFLAASVPMIPEHIFLEYACFRIGVIHTPLDLRLTPAEVLRCLDIIRPKVFVFPGKTPAADFGELGRAVARHCPFVERLIQITAPEDTIEGALPYPVFAAAPVEGPVPDSGIVETDPAQVIFTTGSTGPPKAALLSHRGITTQNMCLGSAFGFDRNTRVLINLPASHVGGQAETLMTALFCGGTAVTLSVFDAARSLEAIEECRVNLIGQIPAMFSFEWRHPRYDAFDLSSLRLAVYGGQQVPAGFLERLAAMAPQAATGLGLTEASGFCTYTDPDEGLRGMTEGIGHAMPAYPLSIRQPMREDGSAGDELPEGELGHVCFRGPQTFLGYVNDAEATARAVSSDGFLYTGDMGSYDSRGLHFAGRSRWIIKPAGYQVFPGDVESYICRLEDVAACGVAGVEHRTLTEAIVAFVEPRPDAALSVHDLRRHTRSMTSYMRPLHFVILEPGQLPLNRAAKVDYVRLQEMARREVERLRSAGRWD